MTRPFLPPRGAEPARLDALVERGQDGLVALWGRRRVGKTRLLLEWSSRHDGLYSVADLSSEPVQRAYLADALSLRFPGFGEAAYPDWRTLLRALAREARRRLVRDHLPRLLSENWEDLCRRAVPRRGSASRFVAVERIHSVECRT